MSRHVAVTTDEEKVEPKLELTERVRESLKRLPWQRAWPRMRVACLILLCISASYHAGCASRGASDDPVHAPDTVRVPEPHEVGQPPIDPQLELVVVSEPDLAVQTGRVREPALVGEPVQVAPSDPDAEPLMTPEPEAPRPAHRAGTEAAQMAETEND